MLGFEVLGVELRVLYTLGKFSNQSHTSVSTLGANSLRARVLVVVVRLSTLEGRDGASQASDNNWVSPRDKAAPG